MRILHLCDQNWVGMANAFVDAHRRHGHEARLVTLAECVNEFEEDICLRLPLLVGKPWHMALKRVMSRAHGDRARFEAAPDGVPEWRPRSRMEAAVFRLREELLWKPRIERAVRRYRLDEFDVYHLESGVGFYRDARFLRRMKERGAHVVCHYVGTDLRDRGVIPGVRAVSDLDLTCEWDHLALDPDLEYFFIPFDASVHEYRPPATDRLRISHAPRNRFVKGTDRLIAAVEAVRREVDIELDLIEGVTHEEAIARKRTSNLLVDQVGENTTATGYGMNSLEAMAMGIPCMTTIRGEYAEFLAPHPFFEVEEDRLEGQLLALARDPTVLLERSRACREWVERTHGVDRVVSRIYDVYRTRGWMDEDGSAVPPGGTTA